MRQDRSPLQWILLAGTENVRIAHLNNARLILAAGIIIAGVRVAYGPLSLLDSGMRARVSSWDSDVGQPFDGYRQQTAAAPTSTWQE